MKNSIIQENIKIPFKGTRKYVYASDVFQQIIEIIAKHFPNEEITEIDFSTHKMSNTNLEINIFDNQQSKNEDIQSIFNFTIKEKRYYGIIKETNNIINTNTEYPESELFDSFNLDLKNKIVYSTNKYNFSTLDIFTSMNKLLLTNLFPEITTGWLSVRVKLDKLFPVKYNQLKVIFIKNISNRYFYSTLFINDDQIGQLYFSIK